jgi:adenine phosphoribosyltransferase
VYSETFALEYGEETLTVHQDAIKPGARVMIVDDVMATGGTAVATANLLKQLGVELVHVSVLMELSFLHGRDALTDSGIDSFSSVLTV